MRAQAARVTQFLLWWRRGLVGWLPRGWQIRLGLAPDRVLLQLAGSSLLIQRDQAGQTHQLSMLVLPSESADILAALTSPRIENLPRWLVLPPGAVLRRRLRLPSAAAERLTDIVRFEIDRQTPFNVADIYYDARVVRRSADQQIEVELVVITKQALSSALSCLGELRHSLSGVDVAGSEGKLLGVNLLESAARTRASHRSRYFDLLLVTIGLLGIAGAAWVVLENRTQSIAVIKLRTEANVGAARAAAAQRQNLVDLIEGTAFLDELRASRPTSVEVLNEMARRLPDDTWLEKVSIEGDRLTLAGYSRDASSLVERLDGGGIWKSAALTGSVQPDTRSDRDRFSLSAQLVPPIEPPSAARGADGHH